MLVDFITDLTASWRVPPSEVKSFWYSMRTTAVRFGSIWAPCSVAYDIVAVALARQRRGSCHPFPGRQKPKERCYAAIYFGDGNTGLVRMRRFDRCQPKLERHVQLADGQWTGPAFHVFPVGDVEAGNHR